MRRAFSLIELLVITGIIALLIGISIPALASARQASRRAASSAMAGQTAQVHLVYAGDNQGFLFAGEVDNKQQNTYTNWAGRERSYFETHLTWSADIGESYVPSGRASEFNSPFDRENIEWGDYSYSCSLTTKPQFWNQRTRMGPEQWTPSRIEDSKYPSLKILTFDRVLWEQVQKGDVPRRVTKPLIASYLDGSSEPITKAKPGYFKGDGLGSWPGAIHSKQTNDGLHTIDGIRGRDR